MTKRKNMLMFSLVMLLLGCVGFISPFSKDDWKESLLLAGVTEVLIASGWIAGMVFLVKGKINFKKSMIRLMIATVAVLSGVLVLFSIFTVLAFNYRAYDGFSVSTPIFSEKNVMIIVPHQDDDINLMGGVIEQYVQNKSEVTVVFSTNGDFFGKSEVRASETVSVLNSLGVKKDNIYFLGFGDRWETKEIGEDKIKHIYNSIDGDVVWTSHYGETATYGTKSIECYLELPYTRNNFLYSIESVIQEKMPDTIFAVDFDTHLDHRGTGLLVEEAMCNVLKRYPEYHPDVYKGFCYGTAWTAPADFYTDLNLLSTKKPANDIWEKSAFGYAWEERIRFPLNNDNISWMLSQTSVYTSLSKYASQKASRNASRILNGDKVFWERRTDSLLYNSKIFVGEKETTKLNDFKLRDFNDISASSCVNTGVVCLEGEKIRVEVNEAVTANCLYLYDNPDDKSNILEGYIVFSDGSTITFDQLEKNGAATKITFGDKEVEWLEIVPINAEGKNAGLGEIEMYYDSDNKQTLQCLMAVDNDDNLVYNYTIQEGDTAEFKIYNLPSARVLNKQEIVLEFESGESSTYKWEDDVLIVTCAEGERCKFTICSGDAKTTFTISNPSLVARGYWATLRYAEKVSVNIGSFFKAAAERF